MTAQAAEGGIARRGATIEDALNLLGFDEVIISTPPVGISRWLDIDLPGKVRALGVPVTEVISPQSGGC